MTFCSFNDCYTLNNSILVSILKYLKHLRTLTFQSWQKKIFTMQKYKNRFVVQNNVRGVFCRTFLSSFAKLYISTFLQIYFSLNLPCSWGYYVIGSLHCKNYRSDRFLRLLSERSEYFTIEAFKKIFVYIICILFSIIKLTRLQINKILQLWMNSTRTQTIWLLYIRLGF